MKRGPHLLSHIIQIDRDDFALIIIIMEICQAPTLRLKALNKHSITHIMYIEMKSFLKTHTHTQHNVDISKGSSITMQKMRAHTQRETCACTLYRLIGVKETVPDVGAKV